VLYGSTLPHAHVDAAHAHVDAEMAIGPWPTKLCPRHLVPYVLGSWLTWYPTSGSDGGARRPRRTLEKFQTTVPSP
jgi:hypothetical protein